MAQRGVKWRATLKSITKTVTFTESVDFFLLSLEAVRFLRKLQVSGEN